MFGVIKNAWNHSGVITTLTKAGMDKVIARHIASSLPKDSWVFLTDCTKNLNLQCTNLCCSIFTLSVFQDINQLMDWKVREQVTDVMRNLSEALEYQVVMGHGEAIKKSFERFEFVSEKYFNKLLKDADFLPSCLGNENNSTSNSSASLGGMATEGERFPHHIFYSTAEKIRFMAYLTESIVSLGIWTHAKAKRVEEEIVEGLLSESHLARESFHKFAAQVYMNWPDEYSKGFKKTRDKS